MRKLILCLGKKAHQQCHISEQCVQYSRGWCSNPDEVLKSESPNRNRTTPASNRIISGYSEVLSLRCRQATFCLFRRADMVCFIYIYIVVLSVCSHPLIDRVSQRRTLRSTGMRPLCEWKLIQTKKPCARCGTSGRFSPFFCRVPNPPPKYTDEAANVYAVTFLFLSGSQPPPTNVQQVFFNEPVHAARPSEVRFSCGSLASKKKISRKRRRAQTDHKPGVHGYLWEEWISEWTTSKRPTPKHSRPPLIRGHWRWTRTNF